MKRIIAVVLLLSGLCFAQGGTTSSNILPAVTGQDLGNTDQRWDLFAKDVDSSGTLTGATATFSGTVTVQDLAVAGTITYPNLAFLNQQQTWTAKQTFPIMNASNANGVRNASLFTGSDIGAKINAAIADFGAAPACGEVIIPAATYSFSVDVNHTGRNGCIFRGQGSGHNSISEEDGTGTVLKYTGSGIAFKNMSPSYHSKITDLALYGTGVGTGIEYVNSFYTTLSDITVQGFADNIVLNGGSAFGSNVIKVDNVVSLGAHHSALWLTGPGGDGMGAYNVKVSGGQLGCSSLTGTYGLLMDGASVNNQFDSVLVNTCAVGVGLDHASSNVFKNISAQGNTLGFSFSVNTDSNLIDNPYLFANVTDFSDASINNIYSNIPNNYFHGNRMASYLQVAPFNGGAHPQQMWLDTDATGAPRLRLEEWTGTATNYYPYYMRLAVAGALEFVRCDSGIPVLPTFNGSNCAVTMGLAANKTATFNGQIASSVVTGTSPLSVASTTVNTNLNADMVDGIHSGNLSAGHAMCWKDTTHMGYCSTTVDASGLCTCN